MRSHPSTNRARASVPTLRPGVALAPPAAAAAASPVAARATLRSPSRGRSRDAPRAPGARWSAPGRSIAALALAAALAIPLAAGADAPPESRALAGFTRIEVRGDVDVAVKEGPFSVAVTGDEAARKRILTRVDGDQLVVDVERGPPLRGSARVAVALPQLSGVALRGSSRVKVEGGAAARDLDLAVKGSGELAWRGKAQALRVANQGSGDVKLEGEAQALHAALQGSGAIAARGLRARDADVAVKGSGTVHVTLAGGKLRAANQGTGEILWWGEGQVESASNQGVGRIDRGG